MLRILSCTQCHTSFSGSAADECAAAVQGKDLSQGVLAAIPGWGDVRLLAPHAELKPCIAKLSCLSCTQCHTLVSSSAAAEPAAALQGKDLSQGVLAVPGWGDVRLLAPRAELELHVGHSELYAVSYVIVQLCS